MGSEQGKLASTQDDVTWKDRLKTRRHKYITPLIIVPFIDRMILIGVLPKPEQGYKVSWNEQDTLRPPEQSNVAAKRAEAMERYARSGLEKYMSFEEFLVRELDYSREDAQVVSKTGNPNFVLPGKESGFGPDDQDGRDLKDEESEQV